MMNRHGLFSGAPDLSVQELTDGLLRDAYALREVGLAPDDFDRFCDKGVLRPIHNRVITRHWVPVNYPD